MDAVYSKMVKFMDNYITDYNKYGGDPKTLPNMLKYYLPDIQLVSFNVFGKHVNNLERILESMTHPGLHEEFTVSYYVVDTKEKVIVCQMNAQFTEQAIHKTYPAKELSVHYYLVDDPATDFKVKKILFFVEVRPPDEVKMMDIMKKYKTGALPGKNSK